MLDSLPNANPVSAIVLLKVDPSKEAAFKRIADDLTTETRKLPGANIFSFQKSVGNAATASEHLIYEDWETTGQFRRQWDSTHLQEFQSKVGDLVVAAPDLRFYSGWKEYRVGMEPTPVQAPSAMAPPVEQANSDISAAYPFADNFVDIGDANMHYITQGSGDPILFLHGNPTWSYTWRNVIPHLSGMGQCIAPDLVGFGRSSKSEKPLTWFDHARYLERFIDKLKLRNITLVLHDHGSGLGFHYAMRHQHNVKAIAFFEAIVKPFRWDEFSSPPFRSMFRQFRTGGRGGQGWQMIVNQNVFIDQLLPQASGRALSDQEMTFYREPFVNPESRAAIWKFANDTPIGGEPTEVWNAAATYSRELQRSPIPKLMLYATPGALLTEPHVQWCKDKIANLKSVSLGPGVHFLQESSPHQIGKEIAQWLAALPARTTAGQRESKPAPAPAAATTMSAESAQLLIDQAGHFNMFVGPGTGKSAAQIIDGSFSSPVGYQNDCAVRPLRIASTAPAQGSPLTARNAVGDVLGRLTDRWLFMPGDFGPRPGEEPPLTPYNPSVSQRFVMLDQKFSFGDGKDGFHGFGTGSTLPGAAGGLSTATATGTIISGFGRFAGHEQGTYVCCGSFSPASGFTGNVFLRVVDENKNLHGSRGSAGLGGKAVTEPGITYLIFRGQAVPTDAVRPNLGPDGTPIGLIVEQGLRLIDMDFTVKGTQSIDSSVSVGRRFGKITAYVTFNPAAPGGSNTDPVPFTAYDEFTINDPDGNVIGGFTANSTEGRVFKTMLRGRLPVIRFGGTGLILKGTGVFEGISGLMTDNSVVSFEPHVSASVYILRVNDPHGKFAARMRNF